MKAKNVIFVTLLLIVLIPVFIGEFVLTPVKVASLVCLSFLILLLKGDRFSKGRKNSLHESDLSTRVKDLEEQITYLENHDPLTGLANRHAIGQHLDQLYSERHKNKEFAVIYVEIDRFKHINDTLGHLKGDQLLQLISRRLIEISPEGSLVGRQGGDEFIIIIDQLDINRVTSFLEEIHRRFQVPFQLDGMELYALPSIGMAMFPHHADQLSTLVANADIAMYRAKDQGGSRIVIYSDQINKLSKEDIQLEGKLHKAMENGSIEVFYQPQVNALTNRIIGAEALIRWKDEELGYIPPVRFIPIAEETGIIDKLSEIVLEDACINVAKWNVELDIPIKVSVNLSSKQFVYPEKLVKQVLDTLSKHQVLPEWVELEITESILMTNMEATTKALNQLRDRGVQISVDDFGTGYSSLSYLNDLPIDTLKIDQSFIRRMEPERNQKAIALAIINLANSLNLRVIAEGVEVEFQRDILLSNNCLEMQGYLFSKPLPANEFERLLFNKR